MKSNKSTDVRHVLPILSAMAWQVSSEILQEFATKLKLRKDEFEQREPAKAVPVLSLISVLQASKENF